MLVEEQWRKGQRPSSVDFPRYSITIAPGAAFEIERFDAVILVFHRVFFFFPDSIFHWFYKHTCLYFVKNFTAIDIKSAARYPGKPQGKKLW